MRYTNPQDFDQILTMCYTYAENCGDGVGYPLLGHKSIFRLMRGQALLRQRKVLDLFNLSFHALKILVNHNFPNSDINEPLSKILKLQPKVI